MKKAIAAVSCFVILVSVAAFFGCGKRDLANSRYVGTWIGTLATSPNGQESINRVFQGSGTRLALNADGTVTGTIGGEEVHCTWIKVHSGVKFRGDVRATAKAEGDQLILDIYGVSLYLAKEN